MLLDFLSGAITMGFAVAGLFFLRFWKRSHERLFIAFALAFWLLGLSQALLSFTDVPLEERSWLYLLRLAAFALILASIGAKNRGASKSADRD
jgi:membrane-associated PAP2 superfamily phosphatase